VTKCDVDCVDCVAASIGECLCEEVTGMAETDLVRKPFVDSALELDHYCQ